MTWWSVYHVKIRWISLGYSLIRDLRFHHSLRYHFFPQIGRVDMVTFILAFGSSMQLLWSCDYNCIYYLPGLYSKWIFLWHSLNVLQRRRWISFTLWISAVHTCSMIHESKSNLSMIEHCCLYNPMKLRDRYN